MRQLIDRLENLNEGFPNENRETVFKVLNDLERSIGLDSLNNAETASAIMRSPKLRKMISGYLKDLNKIRTDFVADLKKELEE